MATEPSTDPSYILQLPMAKAGVKALDTIENFLTSDEAPQEVRLTDLIPPKPDIRSDSNTWSVPNPPHSDWCQQERLGHLVGWGRRSEGDGHCARRHGRA